MNRQIRYQKRRAKQHGQRTSGAVATTPKHMRDAVSEVSPLTDTEPLKHERSMVWVQSYMHLPSSMRREVVVVSLCVDCGVLLACTTKIARELLGLLLRGVVCARLHMQL